MAAASAPSGETGHVFSIRVYYEDTDAVGIVYHSNYLKFAERARTELLRETGLDHGTLRERAGIAFVVSACDMRCRAPARLDDTIEVRTSVADMSGATVTFRQDICRGGDLLVAVNVRLAVVDANGRAVRLPALLREKFNAWQGSRERVS